MKRLLMIVICCLALAARAENVVSVSSASGHPQDEVTLDVSFANTDAAVAFQVEIPLGSQLTYVAGSVALNAARVTDHQVTAAVVDGTLKIFVFSLSLAPFVGNEGALLSFMLKLKNEPGDYTLDVSNAMLSGASGAALPLTAQNGTVTILSPKLSVTTPTLNYGHVPIWSEYTQTTRVSNVGNEPLTISSITFSDAVFSCPSFTETILQAGASASYVFKFAPMVKGTVNATATILSNSVSGNGTIALLADPFAVNEIHVGNTIGYCDSIVEVPVSMNNMEDVIGFQIEFNLNSALEFVDFSLSDRKTDHVSTGVVSGTTLRLMAYSPSNSAFTGDDGVIGAVRFLLKGQYGNYYLNPTKAVLADVNGVDVLSAKYQGWITIRSPRINSDDILDFGDTPVTETVTREYVVRNSGNASMRIDQVVFDQEGFSVAESFPITVNQNSNTTLHVSYSREQAGYFSAIMNIYCNDPVNGMKSVTLSGHRYEPNSLGLSADPISLGDGDVAVAISMSNYSNIVAMQADFYYPYQDYSVSSNDFQLTERFANHLLYAIPTNDSTYRVLVLSLQNSAVVGNAGDVLNVTLHPIGTPNGDGYTVSVANIVLSGVAGTNLFTGEDVSTTFSLPVCQVVQLYAGTNWVSFNVETDLDDLKAALVDALSGTGTIAITIQAKNQNTKYTNGRWRGSLDFNVTQMYMIDVSADCEITLEGAPVNSNEHPITIVNGANWIAYPLDVSMTQEEAFAGFNVVNGDVISAKGGNARYTGGRWRGTVTLTPGQGYIYTSAASGNRVLTFPNSDN